MIASIVIPTHNEEKDIPLCLKSLGQQSLKDFEIIIVDDGSKDNTIKIVQEFSKVKLIKGQHKGPGFSRNLGARHARGNVLVFVDADMTFDKDYLKNLISPILKNSKTIGTTHELEIVNNISNIWSRCWGKIRVSKEEAKDVKVFRAIRKDIFLKLGGFDPKYGYADDQSLWFNHKIRPIVARNAICYHRNPETLKAVYKQSRWIGASIDNSFTRTSIVSHLLPPFMILFFPLAIPLLSIRRCQRNKDFSIFLQMLVFMTVRYLGTIAGLTRKIYTNKNVR